MRYSQAKRTPRGRRGIRVIVVVANLVSTEAVRLWWIFIVIINPLLFFILVFFLLLISVFWLRCL